MSYDGQNRTDEECRYLASDFNKFVGQEIRHHFSLANIDCYIAKLRTDRDVIWVPNQYKLIESKHSKEKYDKPMQNKMLEAISKHLQLANRIDPTNHFEVFRVTADAPYDEAEIYSYETREVIILKGQALREWIGEDKPTEKDIDIIE